MGLVILNVSIFFEFFFQNVRERLYYFLFIIIFNSILLETIMLHLTKMLYKNLTDDQKKHLKKWFFILGFIIFLMTMMNTGLILVILVQIDLNILPSTHLEFNALGIDRVLLYDNITTICNIIGIFFTYVCIMIFFRKIKSDFYEKQKINLEELNYEDRNMQLQKRQFDRL